MEYDIVIDAGNTHEIERLETGLYTFDKAVGSKTGRLGLPLRSMTEISGRSHVGKSTTAYYLSGRISSLQSGKGSIEICDLEGLDVVYLKHALGVSGFKGHVHLIDGLEKGKLRKHSVMIQEGVEKLMADSNTRVVLLDSISAFTPDAESAGDFGESFMGKRAFTLAQFARRSVTYLKAKEEASCVIFINHDYSIMAGVGNASAGGDTLKSLAAIRLSLRQQEVIKDTNENVLGYRVGGTVNKLRYGGKGRKFSLVVIPDYGVSKEMTAVYDASDLGLIDRGAVVKVDGKSIGYISKLFESAIAGQTSKFDGVFEKIEKDKEQYVLGDSKLYDTEEE